MYLHPGIFPKIRQVSMGIFLPRSMAFWSFQTSLASSEFADQSQEPGLPATVWEEILLATTLRQLPRTRVRSGRMATRSVGQRVNIRTSLAAKFASPAAHPEAAVRVRVLSSPTSR